MYETDIEVGRIVEYNYDKEVILGIYMNETSILTYAYQLDLSMYFLTYPYCEDIFQRSLNPQLLEYRHMNSLALPYRGKTRVNAEKLKLWMTKSALQNSDLKFVLDYCKTDIDKVLSYLTEEHKIFLKYRGYCNSLCEKHRSVLKECNTIKLGKCTNLKVGQVLRNYRDNTRIIVYFGNDLFLSTSYFHLINMNFVLGGSAVSYMNRVFDRRAINSEYYIDLELNLCDLSYNREKIKEIVNVCLNS